MFFATFCHVVSCFVMQFCSILYSVMFQNPKVSPSLQFVINSKVSPVLQEIKASGVELF